MGSKMGPNYACLFVGYVEHQIREQYTGFTPQLHKRYMDDIVGAASCRREELESFIDFVSNFQPALQFTSNITETELPFMDINLRISDVGFKLPSSTRKRISVCVISLYTQLTTPPLSVWNTRV